ncbi:lipid-transfer protein [Nitriliruptoraceae bacterium ZYF776]|nr:lipid-transfer protein [Profundirhabdus halotolerans]
MSGFDHRDRAAIVGIGQTEFSKASGRSELSLATEACVAALEDAGLDPADVDGLVRCDHDHVTEGALADALGVRDLTYWGQTGPGGVAPAAMVGQAMGAVLSGQAETVVVYRALNGRSGVRFGQGHGLDLDARVGGGTSYDEFFLPYGLTSPGQFFAMIAQRYEIEHGLRHETLSRLAVTCRQHANANPAATFSDRPLTLEEAEQARVISAPLRLFDFCLETDGACAVVVTSAERAKDLRQPPAMIRAVAQSSGPRIQPGMMFGALLRDSITSLTSRTNAATLYRRAGLGPQDIDVAQLYDCFTITMLLQYPDYGFCAPDEVNDFVADGNAGLGGAVPSNTAGGNLSEGYIHGMNHVLEGVRQIRGTSTSQVEGAEVALVTSAPPPGTSALILVKA